MTAATDNRPLVSASASPPSADLGPWMTAVQQRIEQGLDAALPPVSGPCARLHEAMRYAVMDGGKRIRPLLAFAAAELAQPAPVSVTVTVTGAADSCLNAALALEMIHAYSLVHDDMPCMDDDALRRGKPTVHKRYDEATALLVGDALQSQAFMLLAHPSVQASPETVLYLLRTMADASGSAGMCGGQAIDLESVGLTLSRSQLEQMHRLKTGALLRASVLMGFASRHLPSSEQGKALGAYSDAIGLAFQVVDDILDATTDTVTLGKTAGKDAQNDKPTYVSILGLDASRALARQLRQDAHEALSLWDANTPGAALRLHQLADLIVDRKA